MKNNFDRLFTVNIFKKINYNRTNEFQDIVDLAAQICDTPVALITLLDNDTNHFVSKTGIDMPGTPADISFCQYTILTDVITEITDTWNDSRFIHNPIVHADPAARFYAGSPLKANNGFNVGSLCVIDAKPKVLSAMQRKALQVLGRQVTMLMELELSHKLVNDQLADMEMNNNRLKNIANVQSHDFRGPVASLMGIMNIIKEEEYVAPKEYLQLMEDTIHKLDERIHLIVEYTQVM